jgi:hypothetical protein
MSLDAQAVGSVLIWALLLLLLPGCATVNGKPLNITRVRQRSIALVELAREGRFAGHTVKGGAVANAVNKAKPCFVLAPEGIQVLNRSVEAGEQFFSGYCGQLIWSDVPAFEKYGEHDLFAGCFHKCGIWRTVDTGTLNVNWFVWQVWPRIIFGRDQVKSNAHIDDDSWSVSGHLKVNNRLRSANHRGSQSRSVNLIGQWGFAEFVNKDPRPIAIHHMIALFVNSSKSANSKDNATYADEHQQSSGKRINDCETERPPIDVSLFIVFVFVFGGFIGALLVALYVNYERRVLRASLICCSLTCGGFGILFLLASGLYPYTWGLPPQWLPVKWNPCPQNYRQYFPAWSHDTDDPTSPRRHVTVLHAEAITSPILAVRAAIIREFKNNAPSEA